MVAKAKILPFKIKYKIEEDYKDKISVENFLNFLHNNQLKTNITKNSKRYEYDMCLKENNIIGIVKSEKEHKELPKFNKKENAFDTINIDDSIDYNFFIINKETLKGLWLKYYCSASLSLLNDIIVSMFDTYTRNIAIKNNKKRKQFLDSNKFTIGSITSKKNLDDLQKRFSNVVSIEYTTYDDGHPKNSNLLPLLSYESRKLRFKNKTKLDLCFEGISDIFNNSKNKNIKIKGRNSENKSDTIILDEYLENWGEFDFDELNNDLKKIKLSNFSSCKIIEKMLKKITENVKYKNIFENVD